MEMSICSSDREFICAGERRDPSRQYDGVNLSRSIMDVVSDSESDCTFTMICELK